jgi:hypothetical protein
MYQAGQRSGAYRRGDHFCLGTASPGGRAKGATDGSMPVGSGRFRDLPKTGEESWAGLVPLPLLSIKRAAWHTPTGTKLGMKSRFLLSKATTGNNLDSHPNYKWNLCPLLIHSHLLPFEEWMRKISLLYESGANSERSAVL